MRQDSPLPRKRLSRLRQTRAFRVHTFADYAASPPCWIPPRPDAVPTPRLRKLATEIVGMPRRRLASRAAA